MDTPMTNEQERSVSMSSSLLSDDVTQTLDESPHEGSVLFDSVNKGRGSEKVGEETTGSEDNKGGVVKQADVNANGLQMPGRDASAKEWAAFYDQLGRPQSADEYELPLPQGDDGGFAKEMAPLLYKAGLSSEQASTLAQEWNGYVEKMSAKFVQQQEQAYLATQSRHQAQAQALQQEWGERYDANIELARRAKVQFLPAQHADDIITAIEDRIGVKATLQLLHNIGKGLAEDNAAGLGRPGKAHTRSAAEILFDKR